MNGGGGAESDRNGASAEQTSMDYSWGSSGEAAHEPAAAHEPVHSPPGSAGDAKPYVVWSSAPAAAPPPPAEERRED